MPMKYLASKESVLPHSGGKVKCKYCIWTEGGNNLKVVFDFGIIPCMGYHELT